MYNKFTIFVNVRGATSKLSLTYNGSSLDGGER